jgi:PhnB protein
MADNQFPALIPSIIVSDVRATLDWFTALGFETVDEMVGPDGGIEHATVRRGPDVWFMMGPSTWGGPPGSTGMSIYINLPESVDAYHDQVTANGIEVKDPLTDQFWGDRTFSVQHADGYRITFSEHIRDVPPEEMQRAMEQAAEAMAGAGAPA